MPLRSRRRTVSHGEIARSMSRSARWALLESVLSASTSLLTMLLLSHLLDPAEFGQAGIAVAVSAIVQALCLGGMPDAVVRAPSADTRHTDAAFAAFLGIGGGCALIAAIVGAIVLWPLDQPRLAALIALQGLTGIAVGAAAMPTGLLVRKMRTRQLVKRTLTTKLASMIVSILLALAGVGAWAIVLGNVVGQTVGALNLLGMIRRPRFRRDAAVATTLRVGLAVGLQGSLGTLSTRGFVLAFGAVYGAHAVGLLNFALRLVEESCGLVVGTLRRVTLTSFAAAKRGGLDMKPMFVRGTSVIAYVAAPLFLGVAAVAPVSTPLIFGEQWSGAVPALQLMLVMWVIRSARMLVNAIMVVDGRQRVMIVGGIIGIVTTAAAFLASLPFGIGWSTLAYAATLTGVLFGSSVFSRQSGITIPEQASAGFRPILFAGIMAAAVLGLDAGPLAGAGLLPRLLAEAALGGLLFCALALAFDRPGVRDVVRLIKK